MMPKRKTNVSIYRDASPHRGVGGWDNSWCAYIRRYDGGTQTGPLLAIIDVPTRSARDAAIVAIMLERNYVEPSHD
jgi:hypothetical protein